MKVSKNDFKMLVKECLLEILRDGIGEAINEVRVRKISAKPPTNHVQQSPVQKAPKASGALLEAVRESAGGNPVMADIFADTAATSLQAMLEGDRNKQLQPTNPGKAERIVANADPAQLFGEEASSRWANLAFADSPKRPGQRSNS